MCNEINNDVISNFNCNLISWCGAQWAMSDGVCVCARARIYARIASFTIYVVGE